MVVPAPTLLADQPFAPEEARKVEPKRHEKNQAVTIHFAEDKKEALRQKREKDLLRQFYKMEAQKKLKAAKKKPSAKNRVVRNEQRKK